MSAVEAIVPSSEVPERLRSVAGIDPARLPGLHRLAGRIAAAASEAFKEASIAPPDIALDAIERVEAPNVADDSLFPEGGFFAPLTGPAFETAGFLSIGPRFMDGAISAFFGGSRAGGASSGRAPTNFDRSVAEFVFAAVAEVVETELRPLTALQISKEPLCTPAEIPRLLGEDAAPVLVFRFAVLAGGEKDPLCVIMPERLFTPHRRALAIVPKDEKPTLDPAWLRDMETGVSRSVMNVRVVLSTQHVPLSRVACFAVGQTIELAATLDGLVDIEIEGQRFFRGHVGRSRENYVVRVDGQIDPGQEFLDDILSD